MKILIMGAGKMGSFFIDLLSFEHEVAVYEKDAKRMRFTYNCQRFTQLDEIKAFAPELVINREIHARSFQRSVALFAGRVYYQRYCQCEDGLESVL